MLESLGLHGLRRRSHRGFAAAANESLTNRPSQVSLHHPAAFHDANVPNPHLAGRVIVVVDDDDDLRKLFELILGLAGGIVFTTGDSAHAEQLVSFMQPDLVLLDVDMPSVDGLEVARRLTANPLTASIPFMFVTGTTDLGQGRAADLGAVGFVAKPFDPLELEDAVDAALTGAMVTI
jgi:CheY-like chemotaxis protein